MPDRLTIDDLAKAWHVTTPTAWEIVRTRAVPFIWTGTGEPDLTRRGRKPAYFLAADVAAWEQRQKRVWPSEGQRERAAVRQEPAVTIAGVAIGGRLRAGATARARRA